MLWCAGMVPVVSPLPLSALPGWCFCISNVKPRHLGRWFDYYSTPCGEPYFVLHRAPGKAGLDPPMRGDLAAAGVAVVSRLCSIVCLW